MVLSKFASSYKLPVQVSESVVVDGVMGNGSVTLHIISWFLSSELSHNWQIDNSFCSIAKLIITSVQTMMFPNLQFANTYMVCMICEKYRPYPMQIIFIIK